MFELLVFRKFFQKSVLCFRHCLPKQSPKASVPLLLSTVVISHKGWCLWRRPCGPAGCVCALFIVVAKRCASVDVSTASFPYPEIPATLCTVYQVIWGLSSWCVFCVLHWVFFPREWHSPGASFSLSALTCRISKR